MLLVTHAQHRLDRECRAEERYGGQRAPEFLERDRGVDEAAARPAVLRRDVQPGQLQLAAQSSPELLIMTARGGSIAHPRR